MPRPAANIYSHRSSALLAEQRRAMAWGLGWAATVLGIGAAMHVALDGLPLRIAGALACGALPAAVALATNAPRDAVLRHVLMLAWGAGGAGACILTGGLAGPLAIWCLAPLLVATVLGGGRMLSVATALSIAATAICALTDVAGLTLAAPAAPYGVCLALTGLLTTGGGLASALLLARRRAASRGASDRTSATLLERLASEQPHLLVTLTPKGEIGSAFGFAPDGIDQELLLASGLPAAAEAADRPAVLAALEAAAAQGAGEATFAPLGALHCACVLSVRRASDGGLVGVLRDATLQRAREASLEAGKLEAEQLNAGKSRFLANMSHELRTPLNAIMGFSDMMRARLFGPMAPKYGEYAELIHESGGHLLDLINDVLDMSKIEAERYPLSLEVFDARAPVSAALRLMRLQADEAGISLRGVLPPDELDVRADQRAMKQIVLNLISNAVKFTPKAGQVTVTLGVAQGRVELVVADSGIGIAADDVARLGRPYEQAGDADQKAKGAGLGLSLVRAFAELHGGDMTIESVLGEGTSVSVRLPILVADTERPSAKIIAFTPHG